MTRLVIFLLSVLVAATGLSWLADRPGSLVINWEGFEVETSVFRAIVIFAALLALAAVAFSILRQVWSSPATVGQFLMKRRQRRGLDALSSGMIAVGAGDRGSAIRYAMQARKSLPNEPLTHLLRAQAAQLSGDRATARRIFEAMLGSPDTEQLGLRGLFLEATRVKESEPARQFAERAVRLNPKLSWPVEALFDLQCKARDWPGALETLATARKHGHLDKPMADRRRAVLLTAQAQALEDSSAEKALALAYEAHGLAPALIPAAAIAGRLLAARGSTPKAAKVIQKTWAKAPHPDLATAYAYARIGDSPRDRLDRVKQLAALNPHSIESPIAVAVAAIEARLFDEARHSLTGLLESRMTQRVATLMARIEGEEHGDRGKVREWLARAVNAPRDPAWTADGAVSEHWSAISPVTGALDAFQWRVPVDDLQAAEGEELTNRLESLVTLGAPAGGALKTVAVPVEAGDMAADAVDADVVEVVSRPAESKKSATSGSKVQQKRAPEPAIGVEMSRGEPYEKIADATSSAKPSADSPVPAGRQEASKSGISREAGTIAPHRSATRSAIKGEASTRRGADPIVQSDAAGFPRAPDDPGPDPDDETLGKTLVRSRRAT